MPRGHLRAALLHRLLAHWRPGQLSDDTLFSWWNDELAPERVPKDEDWDKELQLRSVFMASWVMLVHGLYRLRAAAASALANGEPRSPQNDFQFQRAALAVMIAWRSELRDLLWAYARVNTDLPSERNGVFNWRATIALSEWYRDQPDSADGFNKIVAVSFPAHAGESAHDDGDAPDPEPHGTI